SFVFNCSWRKIGGLLNAVKGRDSVELGITELLFFAKLTEVLPSVHRGCGTRILPGLCVYCVVSQEKE
ncbi:2961_t:CDS:2, partial [Gigaspora rosea]